MLLDFEDKKRLYYQYYGFVNTFSLFTKDINDMEIFQTKNLNIVAYEDFNLIMPTMHLPLGKRVEYFFEYLINTNDRYTMIKKNIQIIHNKNTLGELDYILEDKTNKEYLHIELIYKYYVFLEKEKNEVLACMGPNFDDSLQKRLVKLKNKQLPLLYKKESKAYLENIDIKRIKQKLCFKGNIFLEKNKEEKDLGICNALCIKGSYTNIHTFLSESSYKNSLYFFPEKQDWLIDIEKCKQWYSYERILEETSAYTQMKRAFLLWVQKGKIRESLFVVFS